MKSNIYEIIDGYNGMGMSIEDVKPLKSVKVELSYAIRRIVIYYHVGKDCNCTSCKPRDISNIARIISRDWKEVNYAAVPYLRNMQYFTSPNEEKFIPYGQESGKMAVLYFLNNATSWTGIVAKLVKAELKQLCK